MTGQDSTKTPTQPSMLEVGEKLTWQPATSASPPQGDKHRLDTQMQMQHANCCPGSYAKVTPPTRPPDKLRLLFNCLPYPAFL